MQKIFVFVEGQDDERFFNSILAGYDVKIIKYAKEKKVNINNYIKSIKNMPNCDYILVCDIDLKNIKGKKTIILSEFPECEIEKVIVSIAEIESWYLAGVDKDKAKIMKVKYIDDTNKITKEKFDMLIPKRLCRLSFMIEILKNYNIDEATKRNNSFRYFINYFNNIEIENQMLSFS